jgi:hypothetical protein
MRTEGALDSASRLTPNPMRDLLLAEIYFIFVMEMLEIMINNDGINDGNNDGNDDGNVDGNDGGTDGNNDGWK